MGSAQEVIGKITKQDGVEIFMYPRGADAPTYVGDYIIEGSMGLTSASLIYFSKEGELKKIKQNKVKEMSYGNQLFQSFHIYGSRLDRLHEVIMQNDEYILTSYFSLANYIYIHRKSDGKTLEAKVKHSKKRKSDYKTLEKLVPKYFSDCTELMQRIRSNIRNTDYRVLYGNVSVANNKMFKGIQNYVCN